MNVRAGSGWQTVLADLSLILFMLTAAALSQATDSSGGIAASPVSQPTAVYSAGKDAPPLADWLAQQPLDPRQQLTIVAHYAAGGQADALASAIAMARAAGDSGRSARMVVEPGLPAGISATLAYDAAQTGTVLAETLADPNFVRKPK